MQLSKIDWKTEICLKSVKRHPTSIFNPQSTPNWLCVFVMGSCCDLTFNRADRKNVYPCDQIKAPWSHACHRTTIHHQCLRWFHQLNNDTCLVSNIICIMQILILQAFIVKIIFIKHVWGTKNYISAGNGIIRFMCKISVYHDTTTVCIIIIIVVMIINIIFIVVADIM